MVESLILKNTIIIMTSNIGAEHINFSEDQESKIEVFTKDKVFDEIKINFKPEFINRIDEIILFNRLTKNEMKEISKIQILELSKLLKDKKIKINIDKSAENWIINEGFSATYGARPLKRVIQNYIEDKLALMIISNELKEDQEVLISLKNNDLIFKVK